MVSPIEVFCCYARKDQSLLKELVIHLSPLQRSGLIAIWSDIDINAGSIWEEEIKKHLNTAKIILLLISPDFMASKYCYSIEMQRALERHELKETHVIPIILRPTMWQGAPFDKLQVLPTDAKPVTDRRSWLSEDEALNDVAVGIRNKVERISQSDPSEISTLEQQVGVILTPIAAVPTVTLPPAPDNISSNDTSANIRAGKEEEMGEPEAFIASYKPRTSPPVLQERHTLIPRKKFVLFLPVLLVIVSVVLFSAIYFPNLNSQRRTNPTVTTQTLLTRTAIDTVSPSTNPTATASNPYPPKNAPLEIDDSLSTPTSGWQVDSNCLFSTGAYHLHASEGLTSCFIDSTSYTNFVYEISMRTVTYDPKDDTCGGIAFRMQSGSDFYSFLICASGACQLDVMDIGHPYGNPLYTTAECPGLDKNLSHANLIAVVAQGKDLSVFVNKSPVIPTVNDISFSTGQIGVIVIAQHSKGEMAFNNAKLWTLQM